MRLCGTSIWPPVHILFWPYRPWRLSYSRPARLIPISLPAGHTSIIESRGPCTLANTPRAVRERPSVHQWRRQRLHRSESGLASARLFCAAWRRTNRPLSNPPLLCLRTVCICFRYFVSFRIQIRCILYRAGKPGLLVHAFAKKDRKTKDIKDRSVTKKN